jgi:hypothetical protein
MSSLDFYLSNGRWSANGALFGRGAMSNLSPFSKGGLNRSTQHFILKERWSVV